MITSRAGSYNINSFHSFNIYNESDFKGYSSNSLSVDIINIKKEILLGNIDPNMKLPFNEKTKIEISILRALAIPNAIIDNLERSVWVVNQVGNSSFSQIELREYSELCELMIETLKKDLSLEDSKNELKELFSLAFKNKVFRDEEELNNIEAREVSLIEIAVFIRDLDFITFLLDNGAVLNPKDWEVASFFAVDICPSSAKDIEILEAMVDRGYSLEELVTKEDVSLEEVFYDAYEPKDELMLKLFKSCGYEFTFPYPTWEELLKMSEKYNIPLYILAEMRKA